MKSQFSPVKLEPKDRSVEVAGFVLTETVRSSGKTIPPHYHECTNISFVLSGSFIETVGRKPFELSPGSIVLRPAGETHQNQYGRQPTTSLIIEVSQKRLETIRENTDLLDRAAHIKNGVMWNLGFRLHKEMRQSDAASPLAIEGLILELYLNKNGLRKCQNHLR